jgi:hypothetical protein
MFCNGYTCVFLVFLSYAASVLTVSDVCCIVFHLHVANVNLVLHMLQWTQLPQLRVGVEGTRAAGTGNGVDTDRDATLCGPAQAREMERRTPPREAGAGMWRTQQHAYAGAWPSATGAGVRTLAPVQTSGGYPDLKAYKIRTD